jgi:hypothetical protein
MQHCAIRCDYLIAHRPANALRALDLLETCINFLTSASFLLSAAVGERRLEQYLREDLLMGEHELEPFGTVIRQQVKLKHLDGLVELLQGLTNTDPLEKVAVVYRAEMDAGATLALEASAPMLDMEVLLPVYKEFLVRRCVEETMTPDSWVHDALGWMIDEQSDECLVDIGWFANFPAIEMKCAAAAYKYLLDRPA